MKRRWVERFEITVALGEPVLDDHVDGHVRGRVLSNRRARAMMRLAHRIDPRALHLAPDPA